MKIIKTLGKISLGIVVGLLILFALFYVLTLGEYTVPETVAQDPSLPHVTIAGVTYHAETFGDPSNPVVITIHGGPGGDYRSILPLQALADEYFVVFFDQRGSGLSPRVNPAEITVASAIADLDAIVDHFGNGKQVNLVGHSWGAMLAQEAIDADGKFDINLAAGVENFSNKVLFIASECQSVIGADWQSRQMALFPNAELAVIPDAGHEMFAENPEASLAFVREYLHTSPSE